MITPAYICHFLCLLLPLDWEPPEGRSEPYSSLYVVPGTEQVLNKGWQVKSKIYGKRKTKKQILRWKRSNMSTSFRVCVLEGVACLRVLEGVACLPVHEYMSAYVCVGIICGIMCASV